MIDADEPDVCHRRRHGDEIIVPAGRDPDFYDIVQLKMPIDFPHPLTHHTQYQDIVVDKDGRREFIREQVAGDWITYPTKEQCDAGRVRFIPQAARAGPGNSISCAFFLVDPPYAGGPFAMDRRAFASHHLIDWTPINSIGPPPAVPATPTPTTDLYQLPLRLRHRATGLCVLYINCSEDTVSCARKQPEGSYTTGKRVVPWLVVLGGQLPDGHYPLDGFFDCPRVHGEVATTREQRALVHLLRWPGPVEHAHSWVALISLALGGGKTRYGLYANAPSANIGSVGAEHFDVQRRDGVWEKLWSGEERQRLVADESHFAESVIRALLPVGPADTAMDAVISAQVHEQCRKPLDPAALQRGREPPTMQDCHVRAVAAKPSQRRTIGSSNSTAEHTSGSVDGGQALTDPRLSKGA